MTPLHTDVKALAGNKPALVFSLDAFRGFLLNNFLANLERLAGVTTPIDGFPAIEMTFIGLNVLPSKFDVNLKESGGKIFAEILPGFTASFALHVTGNPTFEFSQITINVSGLHVSIGVAAPDLILGNPDFDVTGKVNLSASRDDALKQPGITEEDVLRVEGALAYVMPRRIVMAAFSSINKLDVSKLFTAFKIKGLWELYLVKDGLVIIPTHGIEIIENTGCPQEHSPEIPIKPGPIQPGGNDDYSWPINVGPLPPPKTYPANDKLNGFASIYAPKPLWDAKFSKVLPGITYRESGNGFIGYELSFNIGVEYIGLRIDPSRFGMIIDLSLSGDASVFANVDVPCVGRCDLAYARCTLAKSDLSIFVAFALSKEGKLVLRSSVETLVLGKVDATVSAFSRWLSIAGGKGIVIGFIIDEVLARVIEHNLPVKIREIVRDEVDGKNFQLLDLESLIPYVRNRTFNEVTYSGEPDSILSGLMSNG